MLKSAHFLIFNPSDHPAVLTKLILEESLLLTKVHLVVRQNVSWLFQSSVTTYIPRVYFRDGDALVLSVLRLQKEPVEEVDQGDGVLLGGEYGDHQVRGEAALAQRLVKDCLRDQYLVHSFNKC